MPKDGEEILTNMRQRIGDDINIFFYVVFN